MEFLIFYWTGALSSMIHFRWWVFMVHFNLVQVRPHMDFLACVEWSQETEAWWHVPLLGLHVVFTVIRYYHLEQVFLTVSQSSSRQIGGAVQSPKIGPRTRVFVVEGGWSENIRSSHVVHKDSIRIWHVPRTQFRNLILYRKHGSQVLHGDLGSSCHESVTEVLQDPV